MTKRIKYFYLILFFVFFCIDSYSQKKIKIRLTPEHKFIKTTKVFIIPPEGFHQIFNSLGYANNETGASYSAIQSNKSLSSVVNHLSKDYLMKKGYRIIEIKKLKFNRMAAFWYELESDFYDRTTTKYILVIGNAKEHVMVEAYCPVEYPLAKFALKKSLFTTFYDRDSVNIKLNQISN